MLFRVTPSQIKELAGYLVVASHPCPFLDFDKGTDIGSVANLATTSINKVVNWTFRPSFMSDAIRHNCVSLISLSVRRPSYAHLDCLPDFHHVKTILAAYQRPSLWISIVRSGIIFDKGTWWWPIDREVARSPHFS